MLGSLVGITLITLADIRVQRLRTAGHLSTSTSGAQMAWLAFILPALQVIWAGIYEMVRSIARGRRQQPPFGPFLLAWLTGKAQPTRKLIRVKEAGKERQIEVTEWIRPPRPPGRPRKYPEGWRAHRRTGRPRGRPRKQGDPVPAAGPDHDQ